MDSDSGKVSQFWKKAAAGGVLLAFHCFALSNFLVRTKVIDVQKIAQPARWTLYVPIAVAFVGYGAFVHKTNKKMMHKLDCKYTPIYIRLNSQSLLYGDDDDDEDEEEEDIDNDVFKEVKIDDIQTKEKEKTPVNILRM